MTELLKCVTNWQSALCVMKSCSCFAFHGGFNNKLESFILDKNGSIDGNIVLVEISEVVELKVSSTFGFGWKQIRRTQVNVVNHVEGVIFYFAVRKCSAIIKHVAKRGECMCGWCCLRLCYYIKCHHLWPWHNIINILSFVDPEFSNEMVDMYVIKFCCSL